MSVAAEEGTSRLTAKQAAFVREYLGRANGNATEAARRAGYGTPNVRSAEVLKAPAVAAEIKRVLDERAMPANDVLARLADQARGPSHYLSAAGERVYIDAERMIEEGMGHLIKGVKETVTKDGDRIQTIEFYDAQAALGQLGRHHKLFTDRTEHDGSVEVRYSEQAEQFERRLAGRITERGTGELVGGSAPGVEGP